MTSQSYVGYKGTGYLEVSYDGEPRTERYSFIPF